MEKTPDFKALGTVAAPSAVMTEDEDNYYIRFSCPTEGATVYYNHNFISPSYTPSYPWSGQTVTVPKSYFPNGTVVMTAHVVKEGYADAGVVTLKLTSSGNESDWLNPYSDVAASEWYYSAVRYVTEMSLFDTVAAGKFGPDAPMTRAMLATALYRLAGSPAVTDNKVFTDVPSGAPYANAVAWAYQSGVVTGTGATTFEPGGSITREQIAAMLYRYAGYSGAGISASGDLTAFTDSGSVSNWAKDAMAWAAGAKLIGGMGDGTVNPQGTATRAQVAKMLLSYSGKAS
jgi:hypothetical protein